MFFRSVATKWLLLLGLFVGLGLVPAAQAATLYHVRQGDTLQSVAQRKGVSPEALRRFNHLHHLRLHKGQTLHIPATFWPATRHIIRKGDTLYNIATRYHLSVRALVRANAGLRATQTLHQGQRLYIPARRIPGKGFVDGAKPPAQPRPKADSQHWVWPVQGRISNPFGSYRPGERYAHNGLDISVQIGTPVRASRAGQVTESRADWRYGWGWTVVINHGGGWQSRYAHLSRNLVHKGQYVGRGQLIARSGNTGHSTGPHLHFGVYLHGVAKNPLPLLP